MQRIVLTFGLIAGAILSVMMLLTVPFHDQIGFDKGLVIGYTTMVLAFLMIFVGVKTYRDKVAGGTVTFGRAFKVGLLIMLVASVCYVATWEFIYYNLASDYLDKYAAYSLEKLKQSGASAEQVAAKAQAMAKFKAMYQNPLVSIAFTLLEPLPVGLLFTLVAAAVLSRKRSPQEAVA
jgi:amino acid transporter